MSDYQQPSLDVTEPDSLRRMGRWLGYIATLLGTVLMFCGIAAASASADQLSIAMQSPAPEQGIPLTVEVTGAASAIDQDGDGPYLYAVIRPTGGIGCQATFGYDQAAAGGASSVLYFNDFENNSEEVGPGSFAVQTTYSPPDVGSYLICAWLENDYDDEGDPPGDVEAGPVQTTFATRGPQVGQLSVTLPTSARPGVAFQIDYTTQTDQELSLESMVKPAGGLPCASSYELEQQQNQSEDDVFGGSTSVFGGPSTTTGTDTEQNAGPYVICSWIEGPNNAEVDAAKTTDIYVGTPPPAARPPTPPICIVPRYRATGLSTVERRVIGHHCTIGRIRYAYSGTRRGIVLALSAGVGRHLAHNARIGILVSAGRKPRHRRAA
jgi:hypothetical protein